MNGVFIGRFQPIHAGHINALGQAASRCHKLLILVGSANACRSIKNPWTYDERAKLIAAKLRGAMVSNFIIQPLNDYPYNDSQWMSDVRETIEHVFKQNTAITIFGHDKEGNDYLKWFPEYKFQNLEASVHLNATQVRNKMFEDNHPMMPDTVKEDFKFYEKEKELFKDYPFPETLNFNCGDAVVECQGHIALIKRIRAPGRDAWALPGGFRDRKDNTLLDCAIRELMEETGIKVPEKVIRGSVVKTQLFDSIKRSFGIPRNTFAIYVRVLPDPNGQPPKLKPSDDAVEAQWFTLSEVLNKMNLYDDHKHIVSSLTGVMPKPAYLNAQ